jgi:hypothetical protein
VNLTFLTLKRFRPVTTAVNYFVYVNYFDDSNNCSKLLVMTLIVLPRCNTACLHFVRCHVPWSSLGLLDMCPWQDILWHCVERDRWCLSVSTRIRIVWIRVGFTLVKRWVHWRCLTSHHIRSRNVGCLHGLE